MARLLPAARRYAVTGFLHDPVVDLLVDVNEPIAQPCERAHPLGEIGLDHRLFPRVRNARDRLWRARAK